MMEPFRNRPFHLSTPGKINWQLEVLGKRQDGFHELRTVFCSVDLCDELRFLLRRQPDWRFRRNVHGIPAAEGNLLFAAYNLFQKNAGIEFGAEVNLKKRLPVGGGMGGGSSNAALFLWGLNQCFGKPLNPGKLFEQASLLGADCAYFLLGGTVLGLGRGDQCFALEEGPETPLLLIFPAFTIATSEVYEIFSRSLTRPPGQLKIRPLLSDWSAYRKSPWNELQASVFQSFHGYQGILESLAKVGLSEPVLSGSGSAIFHCIPDVARAEIWIEELRKEGIDCCLAKTTARRAFWQTVTRSFESAEYKRLD